MTRWQFLKSLLLIPFVGCIVPKKRIPDIAMDCDPISKIGPFDGFASAADFPEGYRWNSRCFSIHPEVDKNGKVVVTYSYRGVLREV